MKPKRPLVLIVPAALICLLMIAGGIRLILQGDVFAGAALIVFVLVLAVTA